MKTFHSFTALLVLTGLVVGFSTEVQAQRGWKPQTKGAVIGGVAGGAAGAIINKRNRVVGGVIGGVVGGAAGYAIGKHKDNKNKEAARVAAAERAREAAAEREREAAIARREQEREAAAAERDRAVAAAVERERALHAKANTPVRTVAAVQPTPSPATATSPVPAMLAANTLALDAPFLPNPTYGDQNTAYPTSEYRRKSW
ncbi:glycine zipper 2TM domain-containing protein [Spirosoma sp. BT702]|uniref:Glycine zipper 2TM domain-containing protein n=1 Tax=Spirosoma profusum TaxID=2771354 RepID=A0A926XXV8_9BACT|nr:YMGG-like glycine zipper-containing protein [Spirosoma profusum]MBD2702175.1 glycine zipper 2TM domain-containing protein [Spirosoma profusum]